MKKKQDEKYKRLEAASDAVSGDIDNSDDADDADDALIDPAELMRKTQSGDVGDDDDEDDDSDDEDSDDGSDPDENDDSDDLEQPRTTKTVFKLPGKTHEEDDESEDDDVGGAIQQLLNTHPGARGTTLDDPSIPNENVTYEIKCQDDATFSVKYWGVATRQELREYIWDKSGGRPGNYAIQQLMGRATGGHANKKTRFWYEKILSDPRQNPLPGSKPNISTSDTSNLMDVFKIDESDEKPLKPLFDLESDREEGPEMDSALMRLIERLDEREERRIAREREFHERLLTAIRPAAESKNSLREIVETLQPVITMVAEPLGKLISGQTEGIRLGLELAREAERPKFMDLAAAALIPFAAGAANAMSGGAGVVPPIPQLMNRTTQQQQHLTAQHAVPSTQPAPQQQAPAPSQQSAPLAPQQQAPATALAPVQQSTPSAQDPVKNQKPRSEIEEWMTAMGRALVGNNQRLLAWDYWSRRIIAEASPSIISTWIETDSKALESAFNQITSGMPIDSDDRSRIGQWIASIQDGVKAFHSRLKEQEQSEQVEKKESGSNAT